MTKTEQIRLTHWRFKLLQRATDSRCVARTCRHYGLSRKTFYKWQRRFAEHGAAQPLTAVVPAAPASAPGPARHFPATEMIV
ncbi:MAG: helix-turn-helix domain-containing protein [Steroidobacteraceae bacterium]